MTACLTTGQAEIGSDAPQDATETVVAATADPMLLTERETQSGFLNSAVCKLLGRDRHRQGFGRLMVLASGLLQRTTSDRSFRSHLDLLTNDRQSTHSSELRLRGVMPRVLCQSHRSPSIHRADASSGSCTRTRSCHARP